MILHLDTKRSCAIMTINDWTCLVHQSSQEWKKGKYFPKQHSEYMHVDNG